MENFDWQTAISIIIVTAAAAILLRRVYQWASGHGESGCGSCPSKGQTNPDGVRTKPLVQIMQPKK